MGDKLDKTLWVDGLNGLLPHLEDRIVRKGATIFGPGDLYCPIWPILGLAGIGTDDWTPQYSYWQRPAAKAMDDGGRNLATELAGDRTL